MCDCVSWDVDIIQTLCPRHWPQPSNCRSRISVSAPYWCACHQRTPHLLLKRPKHCSHHANATCKLNWHTASGTLEERTAKCQTTYLMDTDEYVPNQCIYTPATTPTPLPPWMNILPFEGVKGYRDSWPTLDDFISSTGGTADQFNMAHSWREEVNADACANLWPSTGTSDSIRIRVDTAGVSNVAGVYHQEVSSSRWLARHDPSELICLFVRLQYSQVHTHGSKTRRTMMARSSSAARVANYRHALVLQIVRRLHAQALVLDKRV